MRIVIDTNVLISGIFFGGPPRRVLEAVVERRIDAWASTDIVSEYHRVIQEMLESRQGRLRVDLLSPIVAQMHLIEPHSDVHVSCDKDDDKFLSCAVDAKCLYVVSGDKDLLILGSYGAVEIITAREFCERHLS